jgi:hypothetical protein
LVSRKESEQSAEEIELEKSLLNECPASVGDEDDEDFPVENSLGDSGPTSVAVSENSACEKEDEESWDGDPSGDY